MRILSLWLLAVAPMAAQFKRFDFGVTGGVSLTEPVRTSGLTRNESRRYTVGVSMETFLNQNVSLDAGLLFKRTGLSQRFIGSPFITLAPEQLRVDVYRTRGLSWETPVIGKYTFGPNGRAWRPFVGAGFALRMTWETNEVEFRRADGAGERIRSSGSNRTDLDAGAVFAAGVRARTGRFTWVPEVRYTRWGYSAPPQSRSRNQAEALLTLRF